MQRNYMQKNQHLYSIGVVEKSNDSKWVAPTFIIPKKNGMVHGTFYITSESWTNKAKKTIPISKINDFLVKLEGFHYATSLDLNMG